MALTLSEKSQMANKNTFQQRLWAAWKHHAKYWINTEVPAQFPYSLEIQKKKRYGKKILESDYGNIKAIAEFFLNLYNDQAPTPPLTPDGELTDEVLLTSTEAALTFAAFAGVVPGDDSEPIEW